MSNNFILSCESTVDFPFSYMNERNIPVMFYSYLIDGKEYPDDMLRNPDALPKFYQQLSDGKMPTTTQLSEFQYTEFLKKRLQYNDLLHITLGTGMTQSYQNALRAAECLRKKYPMRKLLIVDSLCSSSGYGMIVDYAADMRDQGYSINEVENWLVHNRKRIHHQFFSTELEHYRRSGRMSGATATIATILGICPIMRLNDEGRIIAYGKVRGKLHAIKETVNAMEQHAENGLQYSGKCFVCHSNCPQEAEKTKLAITERFPNIKNIRVCDIGTIIASHCGPGTVAVFFMGDERIPQ